MKQTVKIYPIDSEVYAISEYQDEGEQTHHVAIFPAIVSDVWINKDGVNYQLTTPAGQEWGDLVGEKNVSDDFSVLVEKMKVIWERNANI